MRCASRMPRPCAIVYRLLREEGLLLGSTAASMSPRRCALARQLGPGHTIVTVLCDGGAKYQSRLFNRAWLAERGFLEAAGVHLSISAHSGSKVKRLSATAPLPDLRDRRRGGGA